MGFVAEQLRLRRLDENPKTNKPITTACLGLIDLATQLGELTLLNEKSNAYFIEIASFSHDMNKRN